MGIKPYTLLMVLLTLYLSYHGKAGDNNSFGASFIFGDSLVDAGNNNFIRTLSKANIPPNGIDFKASGGNPTGRFTNGRTIADITGELLGHPSYATPFLAPNTTGSAILYGVNYASGAGGILNASGYLFGNRLGLEVQVDYFSTTRRQIDLLLGPSKAKEYMTKQAIFSITIGSNDILNNYLLPVLSVAARIVESPDAFIGDMITHLRNQLTRLYNLDARKFVIENVGPIGCMPYQRITNQLSEDECAELANKLALQYNGQLKDMLTELNDNLPGATFVYANVYDLMMELITNYEKYGFVTASKPCCGNGRQVTGMIPCGPISSLCKDRDKYVYWDVFHPTEAANVIVANQFLDGDTNCISPINLRQLRNL